MTQSLTSCVALTLSTRFSSFAQGGAKGGRVGTWGRPLTFFFGHFLVTFSSFSVTFWSHLSRFWLLFCLICLALSGAWLHRSWNGLSPHGSRPNSQDRGERWDREKLIIATCLGFWGMIVGPGILGPRAPRILP